jgi:uncharacterized membrane protein (UPF0127 family)
MSLTNQALIADKVIVADQFFVRLRGLIGTNNFEEGQGMLFPRCNNIHMWFMSMPIDVVFLKKDNSHQIAQWIVTSTHENVRPWRPLPLMDFTASDTLELPAGTIHKRAIKKGNALCIS